MLPMGDSQNIQTAIEEYDVLLILFKKRSLDGLAMFQVFWFSIDNITGTAKGKKRYTKEKVGRQYQRVDRNDFAISIRQMKIG